jgi:DNA-binding NarL/FixJ family response regulator
MAQIRVVVADDHEVVREDTRRMLEREAADGREAVRLVDALRPDIVVVDVRLPEMSGIEATREIKSAHPGVRVLVFTAHNDDRYVFLLLDAGADGYVLKTTGQRDLIKAIRDVYRGQTALHPEIARRVVERLTHKDRFRGRGMVESLTEREMEVLEAVAKGWSNVLEVASERNTSLAYVTAVALSARVEEGSAPDRLCATLVDLESQRALYVVDQGG